jgi:hypothetical protein
MAHLKKKPSAVALLHAVNLLDCQGFFSTATPCFLGPTKVIRLVFIDCLVFKFCFTNNILLAHSKEVRSTCFLCMHSLVVVGMKKNVFFACCDVLIVIERRCDPSCERKGRNHPYASEF